MVYDVGESKGVWTEFSIIHAFPSICSRGWGHHAVYSSCVQVDPPLGRAVLQQRAAALAVCTCSMCYTSGGVLDPSKIKGCQ